MKLVIAEKPSVAQSLSAVIGATVRKDGYLEGNGWRVSWCVGHLAGLADADSYDPKYAKWRYDDLPNLLEYAVLEEKAAAATAHHNELSAQIKAAEKRMAEIAVLRTHIVNYAKTREVYVAYRKAGYSKKFREEHEEEILLHQAAKNAFDEMGVKKLPKVKELQTEYAKLLEEKKKTYAEYRRSREEMRELLTAKANVDRVLKMEVEQDVEKEKDHGQR